MSWECQEEKLQTHRLRCKYKSIENKAKLEYKKITFAHTVDKYRIRRLCKNFHLPFVETSRKRIFAPYLHRKHGTSTFFKSGPQSRHRDRQLEDMYIRKVCKRLMSILYLQLYSRSFYNC